MKKKFLIFIAILIVLVGVLPPILAPIVHNNDSPRSAFREMIYKKGHPYQSFFARISKMNYEDKEYGQLYNVDWYDYDSETGATETVCYAKKSENGKYEVSCGTGP